MECVELVSCKVVVNDRKNKVDLLEWLSSLGYKPCLCAFDNVGEVFLKSGEVHSELEDEVGLFDCADDVGKFMQMALCRRIVKNN